jgi:hypothetical protein
LNKIILDNIPFQIDTTDLMKTLHIPESSRHADNLKQLVESARSIGRPKAMYGVAFIESKNTDSVIVDGTMLNSRVLRVNLEQTQRVFPSVATCGTELERWARSLADLLHRFWAEVISEMALRSALQTLDEHLAQRYRPGPTSMMNPGSLDDWPLQEQRVLFALLGNTRDTVGVHLTDSLLMVPTKSVSGILFPTEGNFASCQLCPREVCPNRRAPYDPDLYDRKYRMNGAEAT